MTRYALPALLAFGLAAAPADAQSDPAAVPVVAPVDTMVADTSAVVIQADPDRARELYAEGLALYRAKDYTGALGKYDESLLYGESFAPSGFGRGQALYGLGRLDDARNALEAAVAMARVSDAPNADQVLAASQQWLDTVTQTIESRAATAAAEEEQSRAAAEAAQTGDKVNQAIEMLSTNEITMAQATDAYALLEQARLAGYDPDLVAFYYAKALNAMERGADAVPYAQTAVDASADQADRSAFYIELGKAHMSAGNDAEARAAFEAITEGQAWHGWAQHYITQMETGADGSQD